jgi:hypothetical protein
VNTYLDPARDNGAYKWFIEELYSLARSSVSATRVREHGHPERTNDADWPLEADESRSKELFLRLKPEDRETLTQLLEQEWISAFHDVASFLEGHLSSDEMKIVFGDKEIPASPYWSMHHDLIGLVRGEGWEDEQ